MTRTLREIQGKLDELDPESLRARVLESVKKFKGNWLDLARYLSRVEETGSYREWGFPGFSGYCTRELKLRQQTVAKLLRSYRFLKDKEPGILTRAVSEEGEPGGPPDYENVDILRRARGRKGIAEEDYGKLRSAVTESSVRPGELGKRYRELIRASKAEEEDPEEAWARRRRETLKRSLASLKRVENNLKMSRFLPGSGLETLKKLIRQVEEELTRE